MSESTTVLVQTETVGATVIVTGATVLGTVPIGPQGIQGIQGIQGVQGVPGQDGADGADGAPGADGQGVPVGGTAAQVLAKASGADFDTEWVDQTGGGGSGVVETVVAGTNVDVDSTDPANPIVSMETLVDADIPASIARDAEVTSAVAAEATARDAAIETHRADTTNVHGIADTSALVVDGDAAGGVLSGTYPNPGFAADMATQAELDAAIAGRQPLDADLTALAAAGNSATLAATTASFLSADETKLDGIETGAEVNDTAAEILTKLLTVDGAGSGLDADLLDGQSSAAFQPVDSDLTSIAALTTTSFGRALLELANAGALRSAAGLGTMATETAADYVAKALYDANTILAATSDNTPAALTVGASTFVGRKASGDISAMSVEEAQALLFPAWTSYTPTWSSSAGSPSIGNGTLSGAYLLTGKTLTFRIYLQGGSTTTWGSAGGLYGFSLPGGVTSTATPQSVSAVLFDSSAGLRQGRAGQVSASSTLVNRIAADSGAGVGITVPWTWANGDEMIITGTIEVA